MVAILESNEMISNDISVFGIKFEISENLLVDIKIVFLANLDA